MSKKLTFQIFKACPVAALGPSVRHSLLYVTLILLNHDFIFTDTTHYVFI